MGPNSRIRGGNPRWPSEGAGPERALSSRGGGGPRRPRPGYAAAGGTREFGPDSWVPGRRWAGLQGPSGKARVLGSLKVGSTSSRITEKRWRVGTGSVRLPGPCAGRDADLGGGEGVGPLAS